MKTLARALVGMLVAITIVAFVGCATASTYPLGEALPSVIARFGEQFKEVVVAADDSRCSSFDVGVTPRLVRFETVAPKTVFSLSKTSVERSRCWDAKCRWSGGCAARSNIFEMV